jgi:hypothetical protein
MFFVSQFGDEPALLFFRQESRFRRPTGKQEAGEHAADDGRQCFQN